ncbi:MAG TPA: acetate--CoA ligase family protein [Burkholderiaceae bacterium]|nr:acetate--CoA ligase family protein [Burkholderiaceae bacterium]
MNNNDVPASRAPAPVSQLLAPRSVAVIGASEDQTKFGGRLYRMLIKHGYQGSIYPINPGRKRLFDIDTFPSVSATPEAPDMVVMALPRDKVKGEIEAAAKRGARCGIIITAKFSDAGPEGAALEAEIVAIARAHGMRLIGPNCLGVISPANRVVLCSSPALETDSLPVGPLGFVSQSGALMATIFDRALDMGVGFSHCVSVGNQADLELCDFVEYLIEDPRTQVICTYIEGIKDPQRFVALARRAREAGKPWLAVKAGRTEAGSRAAFSHTASIAGTHAVLAAVCRDENVTLLDDTGTMITLAAAIARHPAARVERVAVLTTSGGGGALAADALTSRGLEMASFAPATQESIDRYYSPGQGQNPVDFGGRRFDDAADISKVTAEIVAADPNTDALLYSITTAPMMVRLADQLAAGMLDEQGRLRKPALWVMQPGRAADGARQALRERGIAFTNHTGEAIDALVAWQARSRFVARSEAARPSACGPAVPAAGQHDEAASKAILAGYGVPVNDSRLARSADEAVAAARELGYPVVMKIVSADIVHKSDVGGVAVGVADDADAAATFERVLAAARAAVPGARIDGVSVQTMANGKLELIVGARRDAQFGPIVVVGAGGVLVELLSDRAIARAPLAAADARRLLESLSVWPVLSGYRGRSLAVDAVVDAIVRVSWLARDLGETDFELDLNPLIVDETRCVAVDARLRVGETGESSLPAGH